MHMKKTLSKKKKKNIRLDKMKLARLGCINGICRNIYIYILYISDWLLNLSVTKISNEHIKT